MIVTARTLILAAAAVAAACSFPAGASAGLRGPDSPRVTLPGDVEGTANSAMRAASVAKEIRAISEEGRRRALMA